jgi:hypothetical protein
LFFKMNVLIVPNLVRILPIKIVQNNKFTILLITNIDN